MVTIAGAACDSPPPWADWVVGLPDDVKKYVTRDSEVVDWVSSWPLSNWVRAAKYIIYYAPKYNEDPTPERVVQVAEGRFPLPDCVESHIPKWREVDWSQEHRYTERDFANDVKVDNPGVAETELFKAAVRIAYWVASKIEAKDEPTPIEPGGQGLPFSAFTPLDVLKNHSRGWNCAGHAVLAAALMRAATIPVRVVAKPGHAWVAFYNQDGRWVQVDPTGDVGHPLAYMQRYHFRPRSWEEVPIKDLKEYVCSKFSGYHINDGRVSIEDIKREWMPVSPLLPALAMVLSLLVYRREKAVAS
ncbi:MAG: transglutaminase-like domain-containing protein [Euryarchaeota archaeon]